jgi:hypothetical protein
MKSGVFRIEIKIVKTYALDQNVHTIFYLLSDYL